MPFEKGNPSGKQGAPLGNHNASGAKPWREVLRRALLAQDAKELRRLAEALIKAAANGDVIALKEIGDRIDGKAVQQIEAKVEGSITITTTDAQL